MLEPLVSKNGIVRVQFGAPETARTIMPATPDRFSKYTVVFTADGKEAVTATIESPATEVEQILSTGTWDIAVTAFMTFTPNGGSATEYAAAAGSDSVTVTEDVTTDVQVVLTPLSITDPNAPGGIFSYTVTFPEDVTLAALTVKNSSGTVVSALDGISLVSEAPVSVELDSGYYDLAISLTNGAGQKAGVFDTVHLYPGLESKAEYTFTDADFTETIYLGGTVTITNPPADMTSVTVKAYGDALCTDPNLKGAFTVASGSWFGEVPVALRGQNVYFPVTVSNGSQAWTSTPGAAEPIPSMASGRADIQLPVTIDSILYIGTDTLPQSNTGSLALSLAWLKTNAADNTDYTILPGADENLPPWTLGGSSAGTTTAANGKTGITITLKGKDAERTVQLSGTGSLFTVGSGVSLILDENISLKGVSDNTTSLVTVNAGGTLELRDGAKISGNTNTSSYGGGVYVSDSGTFTMEGGEISGNTVSSSASSTRGGGVCVFGTFIMEGGTVYGSDEGTNANKLEGSGTKQGVSLYKYPNATAEYSDGSPIIAGNQGTALYTDATLPTAPTYGISLNVTGTHTFPAASAGYGTQAALSVTITNTGNRLTGELTAELSGTNSESFTLSTPAISSITVSDTRTFTVIPNTGLEEGSHTATVTVSGNNGITANFDVSFTVNEAALVSIAVTSLPTKTTYAKGEELVLTGLVVTGTYTDSSDKPETVTGDNVTGYNKNNTGSQTLTVTVGGKTATFDVTVTEAALVSIAVTTLPTKTTYAQGEDLDLTGLVVTGTYTDSSTNPETVTADNVTGYNKNTTGNQTLTVTVGGKTATFDVTVNAAAVVSIAVTSPPTKTTIGRADV
jgi:hypothetical protein